MSLHTFLAMVALAVGSDMPNVFPAMGPVVAYLVCNATKHRAIGGWLMFYYWQVYGGVLVSLFLLVAVSGPRYNPAAWPNQHLYFLFLIRSVPSLLLLAGQALVGSTMLFLREWKWVQTLRVILLIWIMAEIVALGISLKFWPSARIFNAIALLEGSAWFAYFCISKRIRHVFLTHDWERVAPLPSSAFKLG